MAQRIEVLTTKAGNLSLIPGAYMKKEKLIPQNCPLTLNVCPHTHTYKTTISKKVKCNLKI